MNELKNTPKEDVEASHKVNTITAEAVYDCQAPSTGNHHYQAAEQVSGQCHGVLSVPFAEDISCHEALEYETVPKPEVKEDVNENPEVAECEQDEEAQGG